MCLALPLETHGRIHFLLRALNAICVNDDGTPFKENTSEDGDHQAEDEQPSENFSLESLDFAHQLPNYNIKPPPLPADPTAKFDSTSLELPQLTDKECETELERLCTYEGKGAYPWEQLNSKIVEGVTLNHITEDELAQWNCLRNFRIDCINESDGTQPAVSPTDIDKEKNLPVMIRAVLNDILWWGVAIDLCCGIEELDGFFEWFAVKQMTLGFSHLGIVINVGRAQEVIKDVPHDTT